MDVPTRNRTDLKSYFIKNAIPTESNFAELIDAMLNQSEDGVVKLPGNPLCVEAVGDSSSPKNTITIYNTFADENPAWTLNLNPRENPADAGTARQGLNFQDGEANSRLFIDRNNGNVGIGTTVPGQKLHVAGGNAIVSNVFLGDVGHGAAWAGFSHGSSVATNGYALIQNTNGQSTFINKRSGAGHIGFRVDNVDKVAIIDNGNVGIGTTAPAAKLSFNNVNDGSDGPDGITWHNPNPTAYGIHRTAGAWNGPNYQQLRLGWLTGIVLDGGTQYGKSYVDIQGNGLRVTSGNVGIGSAAAPLEPLDVNGRVKAGGLSIGPWPADGRYVFFGTNALNQAEAGNYALLQDASAGGVGRTFLNSPVDIRFRISNTEQMILQNNGNVGIGITNPAAKLAVGGVAVGTRGFEVLGDVGNTHIPWTDGSIYLTGNIAGTAEGDFIFRTYDGSNHVNRFVINGADGKVTCGSLASLDVAESPAAQVRCYDFRIGHSARRGSTGRALVDSTTVLVLNWGGDWTAGVQYGVSIARQSSRTLKDNILELSSREAFEALEALHPVTYTLKADEARNPQAGFIAEEVPDLIATPDRKAVNNDHIVAVLTRVVKEQQMAITALKARLDIE